MTAGAGSFVWYELMTTDLAAATDFYTHAVGWTAEDSGMPGVTYTLLKAGDARIAGAMTLPPEACARGGQPGWIGYVGVDDVDAAVPRLEAAGGTVLRPAEDIPTIGRFAVVADPHGAAFVVFRGEGDAPPTAPMGTPGHVGWRELSAGDGPTAFDFYAGLFGWKKDEAMDMGALGVYQLFSVEGEQTGAVMTKMPETPAPFWLYYFNVSEILAAEARVKEKGGQMLHGPMEVPGERWIIQCLDPQGAVFALVGPRA
jgi:predicted enzyme related to lactoylglutathione lyase